MKKSLGYYQVHRVVSIFGHDVQMMQQVKDEPKELQFRMLEKGIEFPKRRRGEKFRVLYTTIQEAEF